MRWGDITYSILDMGFERVDNISPEHVDIVVGAQDYLTIFDTLYKDHPGDILRYFRFTTANILLGGWLNDFEKYFHEVILLPLTQQILLTDRQTLPQNITATLGKRAYRLSLSDNSIELFTAFTGIVLLYSLCLLAASIFSRTPDSSDFPELDFMGKVSTNNQNNESYDIAARWSKIRWFDLDKELGTVKIQFEKSNYGYINDNNVESYELS